MTALCSRAERLVSKHGFARKIKRRQKRKGVNIKMELNIQTPKPNGQSNGHLLITKKSRSVKTDSHSNGHISIFDPNKYMLKLPKTKKIVGDNGQVRWEKTETDYLPVAARIAWFRKISTGALLQRSSNWLTKPLS